MTTQPEPALRILSLGAGVQSTTLLLLAAEGRIPQLDAAIFSDTQWEPAAVYAHLDRIDHEVAQPAGIPIHRVTTGSIRDDARIRRNGEASLSTYGVAAGLGIKAARTVASALRDKAKALHLTGTAHRVHAAGRMRTGQRYTPAQVVLMAMAYKPRKPEYRTARAHLLLAA